MILEKEEINKIETFRKTDRINTFIFTILMTLVIIFIMANFMAILKLAAEFQMTSEQVLMLMQHVEINSKVEWYEVHIIRRMGYIMVGLVIALFFPIFYLMGRSEMKTMVKLYDALKEKEIETKEKESEGKEKKSNEEDNGGKVDSDLEK